MTYNVSATIDQTVQIGQEPSPGTGTAANRKLNTIVIEPSDEITTKSYRPQGHRHNATVTEDMAMSSWTATGPVDYRESLYLIENIFGTVTPTLLPGATKSYQRIYTVPLSGKLTPKTWIGQWGDANNVNPMLSGCAGIAQPKTTGVTFTASPTSDGIQPAVRTQTNYYLDTTGAGIGVTQITDEILSSDWTYKGAYGPRWA